MLIESLRTVRRRVKLLGVAFGAGVVIACAVLLLLAVVLLDWLLALPTTLRIIVNLAALAGLGYVMLRWVVRPALARLSLSDLAGRLEHAFPQFDDRLRSTVDFIQQDIPGSDVMKQRTVADTTTLAKDVDLSRAVVLKPVWISASGALASVVLLVTLVLAVEPSLLHIAMNRLVGGAVNWPKSTRIDLVSDLPARVAVGQRVEVKMKLGKGSARTAIVRYRYDNGPLQQEVMEKDASGVFVAALDARIDGNKDLGKLSIKIEAGDDERDLNVDVVPRFEVKAVEALIAPPAYAKQQPAKVNLTERPAITAVGSDIQLRIAFNRAVDAARGVTLLPADRNRAMPQIKWSFPQAGIALAQFTAGEATRGNESLRFIVQASDEDHFPAGSSQEYQIIVREDAMPSVQIEEPRRSEERTPDAVVPLKVMAEDDYGIDLAQLVVTRIGAKQPTTNPASSHPWVIDLVNGATVAPGASWTAADNSTERKRFRLEYAWDLAKLEGAKLTPGDVLEFYVQVKDNFNLNGRQHDPVASGKLRITIVSHEQWDAMVEQTLATIRQEIGQIKKGQDVTRTETETQARETAAKQKLDDAQRTTVGRLATQQSTAAAQAKQVAQKLSDLVQKMTENKSAEQGMKQTAKDVSRQLDQASEGAMKQATSDLNSAKDQKSDPKANADKQKQDAQSNAKSLDRASENQKQASQQLQQAMDKLNDFGGLSEAAAKIQEIKNRQEKLDKQYKEQMKDALGKKPDELSPQQKNNLKEMVDRQEQLSKDTEKALSDMSQKADKMARMDPSASKAMKEAAQTGQQQALPQKQSDPKSQQGASQQMEQNQQANAQQKQKEVELGLEMVLGKLQEAERRKLEELQKELAQVQQLVAELIVRQAGHNIDNLALQGPKKLSDLTEQERTDLFDDAHRDEKAELKPDLAVLTPSQEQTERNCRDVAKRAEALADPAPAGKLTAAAAKMEQAIVFLRKSQLAEAYNPPQFEALHLLNDAKKAIDQMKKKADDQLQQQKEESIRQAYVKLLEQQKKLDKETVDIDATPKDGDGNLPFLVARRLGQLPGEQGKLSTDATELGKKLQSLESIVYLWANKDIVSSMDEVKDDLAKPATGKPTQAEQARIEEQLAAMIDNLKTRQAEREKFANRNNGGGQQGKPGQKPPPKMPSGVELRLLRDLQQAVNKSTTKINAEEKKDAQKLLSLGGRQGEIRSLLDQLLQKATNKEVKLGPEPDNKDQLPEEASKDAVDDQELIKGLLDDNLQEDTVNKSMKLTGDRMARSRQRLALNNDPGKVTQEIQKRIVMDMDEMIKLAQKQQMQMQQQRQRQPGDKPGQPQPGQGEGQQQAGQQGQQNNKGGLNPAQDSTLTQGNDPQVDVSRDLKEKMAEWGGISKRDRQAVMEGANEKVFRKYEKFIDDYYREVAKKASER
jgi:hypothetical protein